MKVQIRRGVFETNSSSVHTLSIVNNSDVKEYPESVRFESGDFGWENEVYQSTEAKAAYIWEGMRYMDPDDFDDVYRKIVDTLERNGIKPLFEFNNKELKYFKYSDREYAYYKFTDEDGNEDTGYLDHARELEDFIKHIANNEQHLLNFLFDHNSYIITGNDNQNVEDFCDPPNNIEDTYEYIKGN